ncbi:hypothetical protein Bbelb_062490 [Branchiostoma belcheri]|nr:hypothetical protein Bbelb_062490 [Branchiostoma belcheri]
MARISRQVFSWLGIAFLAVSVQVSQSQATIGSCEIPDLLLAIRNCEADFVLALCHSPEQGCWSHPNITTTNVCVRTELRNCLEGEVPIDSLDTMVETLLTSLGYNVTEEYCTGDKFEGPFFPSNGGKPPCNQTYPDVLTSCETDFMQKYRTSISDPTLCREFGAMTTCKLSAVEQHCNLTDDHVEFLNVDWNINYNPFCLCPNTEPTTHAPTTPRQTPPPLGRCSADDVIRRSQDCESEFIYALCTNPDIDCVTHPDMTRIVNCTRDVYYDCVVGIFPDAMVQNFLVTIATAFNAADRYCNGTTFHPEQMRTDGEGVECAEQYSNNSAVCIEDFMEYYLSNKSHPLLCREYASMTDCKKSALEDHCHSVHFDKLYELRLRLRSDYNPFCQCPNHDSATTVSYRYCSNDHRVFNKCHFYYTGGDVCSWDYERYWHSCYTSKDSFYTTNTNVTPDATTSEAPIYFTAMTAVTSAPQTTAMTTPSVATTEPTTTDDTTHTVSTIEATSTLPSSPSTTIQETTSTFSAATSSKTTSSTTHASRATDTPTTDDMDTTTPTTTETSTTKPTTTKEVIATAKMDTTTPTTTEMGTTTRTIATEMGTTTSTTTKMGTTTPVTTEMGNTRRTTIKMGTTATTTTDMDTTTPTTAEMGTTTTRTTDMGTTRHTTTEMGTTTPATTEMGTTMPTTTDMDTTTSTITKMDATTGTATRTATEMGTTTATTTKKDTTATTTTPKKDTSTPTTRRNVYTREKRTTTDQNSKSDRTTEMLQTAIEEQGPPAAVIAAAAGGVTVLGVAGIAASPTTRPLGVGWASSPGHKKKTSLVRLSAALPQNRTTRRGIHGTTAPAMPVQKLVGSLTASGETGGNRFSQLQNEMTALLVQSFTGPNSELAPIFRGIEVENVTFTVNFRLSNSGMLGNFMVGNDGVYFWMPTIPEPTEPPFEIPYWGPAVAIVAMVVIFIVLVIVAACYVRFKTEKATPMRYEEDFAEL